MRLRILMTLHLWQLSKRTFCHILATAKYSQNRQESLQTAVTGFTDRYQHERPNHYITTTKQSGDSGHSFYGILSTQITVTNLGQIFVIMLCASRYSVIQLSGSQRGQIMALRQIGSTVFGSCADMPTNMQNFIVIQTHSNQFAV